MPRPPASSLTPTALTFPSTGVGLASPAQTLTLTNNGGLPLTLAAPTLAANFTLAANSCPATLAVNGSCTLQIVFTPTAPGPITGTLTLADNAPNTPQTVNLAGTAIDFALTPNGPTTATLASGSNATYALLLTSTATLSGSVALSCSGVPAHASCVVSPTTPQLGQTVPITVTIETGLAHNLRPDRPFPNTTQAPILLALLAPIALFLTRRRRLAKPVATLLLLAAALTTLNACGTGRYIPTNSSPVSTPTPSGTYNLTVTGSTAGISHSVALTLIVQ